MLAMYVFLKGSLLNLRSDYPLLASISILLNLQYAVR